MPEEFKPGCKRPPIKKKPVVTEASPEFAVKEAKPSMVRVGQPAPDFSAPGFLEGKFLNFDLAELRGKWVLLCFYPGDFTFV